MLNVLIVIISAYILVNAFELMLDYLNYKHLKVHGDCIPREFEGFVDPELLQKTREYTLEKMRFGLVVSVLDELVLLVFIFGGFLRFYHEWINSLNLNFIVSGLIFFIILTIAKTFIGIPSSLYSTFKIEKKYGFNTMTWKLWLVDFLKSIVISILIMSILLGAAFLLVKVSPGLWWFFVWCFFFIFSIIMMYVSPYILEPLFNKFTPIEDEDLAEDLKSVMQKAGLKITRVFQMDASKRTKHSNAYFTGVGHVKRIVLFDTILKQLEKAEIISVLAHEAGHWKKKHLLKMLVIFESLALAGSYISYLVLKSDILCRVFYLETAGFEETFCVKLILLSFIASIVLYPLTPLFNIFSRRNEREADDFACALTGTGEHLASSMIKLTKENLSNMHPHPLYSKFHYSHPPAPERIRYLRNWKVDR